MTRLTIRTGDPDEFFDRARYAAIQADQGGDFAELRVTLQFEDPKQMLAMLSEARRRLIAEVLHTARSAEELAERLHRERTGIMRDIRQLERFGLLIPEPDTASTGVRRVRAAAPRIELIAAIG